MSGKRERLKRYERRYRDAYAVYMRWMRDRPSALNIVKYIKWRKSEPYNPMNMRKYR